MTHSDNIFFYQHFFYIDATSRNKLTISNHFLSDRETHSLVVALKLCENTFPFLMQNLSFRSRLRVLPIMLNCIPHSSTHEFRLTRPLWSKSKRGGLVTEEGTTATFERWFSLRPLSWIARPLYVTVFRTTSRLQ